MHNPLYEGLDARHADVLQYLQRGAASATKIAAALGVDVNMSSSVARSWSKGGLIEPGTEFIIRRT